MFIDIILVIIQTTAVIITLVSVILIYRTIKSNEKINQRILFSNVTKEERELRMKLQDYRERLEKRLSKKEQEIIHLNYETLLFNYYEYLAICVNRRLINEEDSKLYFRDILRGIKRVFDESLLFKNNLANKEEY